MGGWNILPRWRVPVLVGFCTRLGLQFGLRRAEALTRLGLRVAIQQALPTASMHAPVTEPAAEPAVELGAPRMGTDTAPVLEPILRETD